MYFRIKDENFFDKYMKLLEKVSNMIKKINSELIYNNKYLKVEKSSSQKKALNVFIYQ